MAPSVYLIQAYLKMSLAKWRSYCLAPQFVNTAFLSHNLWAISEHFVPCHVMPKSILWVVQEFPVISLAVPSATKRFLEKFNLLVFFIEYQLFCRFIFWGEFLDIICAFLIDKRVKQIWELLNWCDFKEGNSAHKPFICPWCCVKAISPSVTLESKQTVKFLLCYVIVCFISDVLAC